MKGSRSTEVGLSQELLPTDFRAAQLFLEGNGVTGYLTRRLCVFSKWQRLRCTGVLNKWAIHLPARLSLTPEKVESLLSCICPPIEF